MESSMNSNNANINSGEIFDFHLGQSNKIRPKSIRKLDIIHLIRTNQLNELNEVLNDLSQEDFEENDYYELTRDEQKLIKSYQFIMQYMMYSVNSLTKKNQFINSLANKQASYNEEAQEVLLKQQKKIKEQEDALEDLNENCANMEYLIKKLHLEDQIMGLGMNKVNASKKMSPEEMENLRNKMEFPEPKSLGGD